MKFWDSSGVVPLLAQQSASARMEAYFREDAAVIMWWGTKVQCDSAIARLEREHQLEQRGQLKPFDVSMRFPPFGTRCSPSMCSVRALAACSVCTA